MIIFPKKDIIPIIVPQICFMDKYGNTNSYLEMNISLFIEEDVSKSIYYKITSKIIDTQKLDIENFEYNIF